MLAAMKVPGITIPRPPALDLPVEPPGMFSWVWTVFQSLNKSRHYHTNGFPLPISNQELLAWCTLHKETLSNQEMELIRRLDVEWINSYVQLQREISNVS